MQFFALASRDKPSWLKDFDVTEIMKRALGVIVALPIVLIGVFLVWWASQTPTYVHRFRLVIEAEADGALRSGASVIEVRNTDFKVGLPESKGMRSRATGEAAFVDLGNGKHVIAILGFGPTGSEDGAARLAEIGFLLSAQVSGTTPLADRLIPTLVTFTDLNDPKTARVVRPQEFEAVFDPGVRFKRAFVEMVSTGTWPFSAFGWPSALAGEPVTREIEVKLPWLRSHKGYLAGLRPDPTNTRPSRNLTGNEFIKGL